VLVGSCSECTRLLAEFACLTAAYHEAVTAFAGRIGYADAAEYSALEIAMDEAGFNVTWLTLKWSATTKRTRRRIDP
jgi:hypothetical protein